jgi:uncharacterized repeat protein (TIGR01451 family)
MAQRITRICLVGAIFVGLLLHLGGVNRDAAAAIGGGAAVAVTPTDWDGLLAKLRVNGSLAVIVGLHLPDQAAPAEQTDDTALQAHQISLAQAQAELLARLAGQTLNQVRQFEQIPFVAMRVDEAGLLALRADALVRSVGEDLVVTPALERSVPIIRADLAHGLNYRGAGRAIAILDSGFDTDHPDLDGRVVSEACYSTTDPLLRRTTICPNGQFSQVGSGASVPPSRLIDGFDHGTHVAAIAAAAAPSADIIAIQVFGRVDDGTLASNRFCADAGRRSPCVLSRYSDLIQGLQRVFALRSSFNIAAVNLSLGSGGYNGFCDNDPAQLPLKSQIDILRSFGIATVVSSGNSGHATAIGAPACISSTISVGNSTTSFDPAGSDRVHPSSNVSTALTMFAPGTPINAAVPETTVTCTSGNAPDINDRCYKGGTSMAAPHVAGALAVLRSAAPNASVNQLIDVLTTSSIPRITDPRNGISRPRLDVYRSLCRLVTCDPDDFRFLTLGSTVTGVLSLGDNDDTYFINGTANTSIRVSVNRNSGALDPFVSVYDPLGNLIAINNNGGGGVNALVDKLILPRTGRYRIVVSRGTVGLHGGYTFSVTLGPLGVLPVPFARALQPFSATVGSAAFWLQIDGANFIPQSQVRVNGSLRPVYYSSSERIWVTIYSSDMTSVGSRSIVVTNPAPGGGSAQPLFFTVSSAFNGESILLAPATREAAVGQPVTFAVEWTHPSASWRNTQNMDLKLMDEALNTVLWLRFTEANPASTVTLLGTEGTPIASGTLVSGQLGDDIDLLVTDTVTLHLGQTRFFGSGQTVVVSPTVTFGPAAVGAYTIRYSVDDDAEQSEIQDADVFGRFRVLPQGCSVSLVDVAISGPTTGRVGMAYSFSATPLPAGASAPISYQWTPEPESGQGSPNATYRWDTAGEQAVGVVAQNCGDRVGAVQSVAIHTITAPDLSIAAEAAPITLPDAPITYTLTVKNSGANAASDLMIAAELPAGASYVSGGTHVGNSVHWTLSNLAGSGATEQRSFVVRAPSSVQLETFTVTASGGHNASGSGVVATAIVRALAQLSPLAGGTLSATTASQSAEIVVPGGAVFASTTLAFDEQVSPTRPLPARAQFGGRAFTLRAFQGDVELPELAFGEAVTISLPTDTLLPLDRLSLYRWDGVRWTDQGISCAPGALGRVACSAIDLRPGEFALLTRQSSIFLPLIR